MRARATIKFYQQPINGDKINLKWIINNSELEYDNTEFNEISKTFVLPSQTNLERIGETELNADLPQTQTFGSFNARVRKIKKIYNELVVLGDFTEYEFDSTVYDAKGIIFLNPDTGAVSNNTIELDGDGYDAVERNVGGVGDVIDIVGDFETASYRNGNSLAWINSGTVNHYLSVKRFTKNTQFFYNNWLQTNGVNNKIRSAAVYGESSLLLGGDFIFYNNSINTRLLLLNSSCNQIPFSNSIYSLTINGSVTKVLVDGIDIIIAGGFSQINSYTRKGIARFYNISGVVNTSFNAEVQSGTVYDVYLDIDSLVISGNFTGLTNNNVNGKIAKINKNSGDLDTTFNVNTTDSGDIIYNINKVVTNWVFGGFFKTQLLDSNGGLITEIPFNASVYTTYIKNDKIVYGGDFTIYDTSDLEAPNNVLIGASINETRNNLLSNLEQYNAISSDINYTNNPGNNTWSIFIDYEYNDDNFLIDVIDILNAPEEPIYRVEILFENDGSDVKDLLRPYYLRSDTVIKSKSGSNTEWNNVDFKYKTYLGDLEDYFNSGTEKTINKLKLLSEQTNQYLNISPLLPEKVYNPNLFYSDIFNNVENILSLDSRVEPQNQICFAFNHTINKINSLNVSNKFDSGLVLDGFKRRKDLNKTYYYSSEFRYIQTIIEDMEDVIDDVIDGVFDDTFFVINSSSNPFFGGEWFFIAKTDFEIESFEFEGNIIPLDNSFDEYNGFRIWEITQEDDLLQIPFIVNNIFNLKIESPNKLPIIYNHGRFREIRDNFRIAFNTIETDLIRIYNDLGQEIDSINLDIDKSKLYNTDYIITYLNINLQTYLNLDSDNYKTLTIKFYKRHYVSTGNTARNERYFFLDEFQISFDDETNCYFSKKEILFKNSFGLLESFQIKGSYNESIDTDEDDYLRPIRDVNGNYNEYDHTNKTLYKDGKKEITINTGNIDERLYDQLEDLVMSKEIWIVDVVDDNKLTPVKLEDDDLDKRTNYKDGVINYTLTFSVDNTENTNIL